MTLAAVLLAAGRSTRFGPTDKLAAPLGGRPLAQHAADTLRGLDLPACYCVAADPAFACPGFTTLVNDQPAAGLSRSIGLGVAAARRGGATAVLLALADMPLVPPGHFRALIDHWHRTGDAVASGDEDRAMPPALFPASWFDRLEQLAGDRGARDLLASVATLRAPPGALVDIDRPDDLAAVARRVADAAGTDEQRS